MAKRSQDTFDSEFVVGEATTSLPKWNRLNEPPDDELSSMQALERYEVRRRIGRGGMGVVYDAYDRKLAQRVALKTVRRTDERAMSDFKREFRAASQLSHPNLAALYELFVENDVWFFTMELVDGVDLLSYVRALGDKFDDRRLRHGMAQLALAVQELHAHGLMHQDIKPSNVLVDRNGRVVVLDFGLAHYAGVDIDEWGRHISDWGTPAYLAPERRHGDPVAPASDWFSVGCIL